ncbi:MAG: HAMP domain-containing sensor histidine kinase [Gemmatimonadaceae bacterium]
MMQLGFLRRTRPMQAGFLILLTVCGAQLAYWMLDEVRYTSLVEARGRAAYEAELASAQALLKAGVHWSDVSAAYPDVTMSADSVTPVIDAKVLERIGEERFHRLNRYAWEGAFFLAVLLASMAVVYRAVREEADLHRKQEDFLAAVSHELKSPLASLRLSVDTLAMRDPPAARRAELVERLQADLGRLQRMIANVLDTSRLSSGELRGARERQVLADEVDAVVDEMREQALEGASRLHTDVPADLVIVADPDGLRTVLRNLAHNAIKATSGGGEVRMRAERRDGHVRLQVIDDGTGFPPHEADRLFEKFYRVESDNRARTDGTGLGLFLVKRCVELDGGTLAAESAGPGKGACFTVTWPAAPELAP